MTDLTRFRAISRLENRAAQTAEKLALSEPPSVMTQNGEAHMVMESVEQYQANENLVALLKIIALGEKDRTAGLGQSFEEVQSILAEDRIERS